MRGMRRGNKIDRMVSEWRGILAGQANGREGQQADDNKE